MNLENRIKFSDHAKNEVPREACGMVILENGIEKLIICKNKAEYDFQFIIDPLDYVFAEERGEVIGIVHSHPTSSAKPSEADKVACSQSKLTWYIYSCSSFEWFELFPSFYRAPLVGREWCHGVLDCYSLIRDYYKEELKIEIPDYDREFEWWVKGKDLYCENFKHAGFVEIRHEEIEKNDVILMQCQSPVINHGGIYLGNGSFLHHLHKRLSSRDIYGGYWLKHTVKVLRHRSLINANN